MRALALLFALLLSGGAAFDTACASGSAEQELLTEFFHAARLRDNTALANIATVTLNPRTEGVVETFEIVSVATDQRSKRVTVSAQVRTPHGETVPRTLVFTFERAVGTGGGQTREGRWMITGLRPA